MFVRFSNSGGSSSTNFDERSHLNVSANMTFNDVFLNFYVITNFGVIPIVSLLGIAGNVVSMVILFKHGLNRRSNVLIFALAVADTTYLVGINNIPLFIYQARADDFGFFYSETTSMALYVLYQVLELLETVGKVVSLLVPVLIIVERFLAVFWPLHVSRLLTARRIKTAAILLYPLGIPPYVFFKQTQWYVYCKDPATETYVGRILNDPTSNSNSDIFNTVSGVYTTLCGPVSLAIVVIGFALVGVKIHLQGKHRRDMMTHLQGKHRRDMMTHLQGKHRRDVTTHSAPTSKPASNPVLCFKRLCFNGNTRTESYEVSTLSGPPATLSGPPNFESTKEMNSRYSRNLNNGHDVLARDESKTVPDIMHPGGAGGRPEVRETPSITRTVNNNGPSKFRPPEATRGMRTTKILLSVCVVYSLTASMSFITDMFISVDNVGFSEWAIIHRSGMTAICINSTINFVIYVALNRNFRETYKQLICTCLNRTRQGHQ